MTNGEYIYRKTVDYMSRMALEKDDFRTFLMIWEFLWKLGRGARCIKIGNGPLIPQFQSDCPGLTVHRWLGVVVYLLYKSAKHHFFAIIEAGTDLEVMTVELGL